LTSPTIQAAADKAKVSKRSLMYWLKQPAFAAAYRAARQQVVEHAVGLLQQTVGLAAAALARNLNCGRHAVEVSAANSILQHAVGSIELFDLAGRVAELEERLARQGGAHAFGTGSNGEAAHAPGR
jgi:hypothetical protein